LRVSGDQEVGENACSFASPLFVLIEELSCEKRGILFEGLDPAREQSEKIVRSILGLELSGDLGIGDGGDDGLPCFLGSKQG